MATLSPSRFILIDRDGVLNVNRADYTKNISELIVAPGAAEAVKLLTDAGYGILVLTNQAGVAKGLIAPTALIDLHRALQEQLEVLGGKIVQFYVCPHLPTDLCACRKPAPGLVLQARADWHFDLATTWFVGDATRDAQAAIAAGCRPAMVRTAGHPTTSDIPPGVPMFDSLLTFVLEAGILPKPRS